MRSWQAHSLLELVICGLLRMFKITILLLNRIFVNNQKFYYIFKFTVFIKLNKIMFYFSFLENFRNISWGFTVDRWKVLGVCILVSPLTAVKRIRLVWNLLDMLVKYLDLICFSIWFQVISLCIICSKQKGSFGNSFRCQITVTNFSSYISKT